MPLKKLSYQTAQIIVDLYSSFLVKEKAILQAYGYSELQGYNIVDIDNSTKLIVAYDVFNKKNEEDLERIREFSTNAGGAVCSFFHFFVPDEVIPDIDKLDPNDMFSSLKFANIVYDYEETPIYKTFLKRETHESFLNFCLSLSRSDENYWEKVYNRLDLVIDTKNPNDQIFFIVKNKHVFFK